VTTVLPVDVLEMKSRRTETEQFLPGTVADPCHAWLLVKTKYDPFFRK